jgi:hypothetical protein
MYGVMIPNYVPERPEAMKSIKTKIWPETKHINTGNILGYAIIIHSFNHQLLYSPLLGPGLFLIFVIFSTQTVGHLGRVISSSQGRYLYTE